MLMCWVVHEDCLSGKCKVYLEYNTRLGVFCSWRNHGCCPYGTVCKGGCKYGVDGLQVLARMPCVGLQVFAWVPCVLQTMGGWLISCASAFGLRLRWALQPWRHFAV